MIVRSFLSGFVTAAVAGGALGAVAVAGPGPVASCSAKT